MAPLPRLGGFTLVELLVVIGIIAVLIGLLLPVLSGVQARGRDMKCQANLRSMLQAIQGYAAEHKGSLPYGLYFAPEDPFTYDGVGPGTFVSWASQVGKYTGKRLSGDNLASNFPPYLQCPEAAQAYAHVVGYVANMVAMPSRPYERDVHPHPAPIIRPAVLTGLFPHNILIHDTSVGPGLERNVGYLVNGDVDDVQRFWTNIPQHRYYDPADVYGRLLTTGGFGNNKPVKFNASQWKNIDPGSTDPAGPGYPYQGNLRFRHNKNTTVNCGFADGHVESFRGKFNGDGSMQQHDVLRKYFMIKWPPGIARNNSVP